MPNVPAGEPPLPETARRLIADVIDLSGYPAAAIVKRSQRVAEDFSPLNPALRKYPLHPSSLSRWRHGKGKRLYREKLILLKLTVLHLADSRCREWSGIEREAALDKAAAFAEEVLAAVVEGRATSGDLHPMVATSRHRRTEELLGAYGEILLRQTRASNSGEPEAKLALLHQLGGDNDDARYWADLAAKLNPLYVPPSAQREWCDQARRYAADYQRANDLKTARMYLGCAADRGDGEAAYQLGQMAELEGDRRKAMDFYYQAADLGYPDGRTRAESLKIALS
ncbi:hypothetical protein [Streptosporangium sandarakinum]